LSAGEGAEGEIALREKFRQATDTFAASAFSVHCPDGKEILLSEFAAAPSKSSKVISTNRIIVPRDGGAMLVVFEAKAGGD
jgi:hypothetical protein